MSLWDVAGDVIGGFFGGQAASGDRDSARAAMQQAYQTLSDMGVAPDLSKEIILEKLKSSGNYTPQMEQDLGAVHSLMTSYKEAPEVSKAQMDALQAFKDASRTGMSMTDRLALEEAREASLNAAKADRETALQRLQETHQGGSGAEVLANLAGGQNAMNRLSRENLGVAANAQKARMDALAQMGNLSGQMRGQNLAYAQATRGAEDTMAKFNAENSMARQQRNVASGNQGQLYNLQNQQDIMKYNVEQANKEKQRQVAAKGDQYDRELKRREAMSKALTGQSDYLSKEGDKTASSTSDLISGGIQLASMFL
jgi:hypothetical protein